MQTAAKMNQYIPEYMYTKRKEMQEMCSELQYQLIWLKPEPECSQTRKNSNFFRANLLQNGQQDFQAGLEQLAGFLDLLRSRTANRIFRLAQKGQQDFWAGLEQLAGFLDPLRTASRIFGPAQNSQSDFRAISPPGIADTALYTLLCQGIGVPKKYLCKCTNVVYTPQ